MKKFLLQSLKERNRLRLTMSHLLNFRRLYFVVIIVTGSFPDLSIDALHSNLLPWFEFQYSRGRDLDTTSRFADEYKCRIGFPNL